MTATELRVTLPGPEGSADAARALKVLEQVIKLLGQLDDASRREHRIDEGRTSWPFTDLKLGSVVMAIAPPRADERFTALMTRLVDGFDQAERAEGVPSVWDLSTAATAADLARLLDGSMRLELVAGHTPVKEVTVTRQTEQHLRHGLRQRHTSIGSVIGRLESFNVHGTVREAGLWPQRGGPRVAVRFDKKDKPQIIAALDSYVEVSGRLERDAAGRPVSVKMRHIEIIHVTDRPLTDLIGLDPDFTDGMSTEDYLREIRGAA